MNESEKTPIRRSRRWLLGAGSVSVIGGGAFAATWFNVFADASAEGALTVEDAHQQARDGSIYLVDIRRPDEWKRTGIGADAIPIDMRRKDFGEVLTSIFDTTGPRPVALICARGVRSARTSNQLIEAGFTNIIDVPEGMLGSAAGPGWLERGLPVEKDS